VNSAIVEPSPTVLGMLGVDRRAVMLRRFHNDTLTLTIPWPLFLRMEEEARDSVLQIPGGKGLRAEDFGGSPCP